MKTISRYIMTLALLITAATGAWADNVLYATVDGNTMTLMFGEKPDGAYVHDASNSNWATSFKHAIFTAVIDASCRNFDGNSTRYLFYKFDNISSIEGLSNLNTENVTRMDNMFEGCKPLTSIDLSNFNTAKVTSMAGMFNSCEALPSIDLSSFNTANVTSMSYMFKNCSSLTTITVGEGWNTDKVTSSREMFTSCSKLPNFNSGKTDKTNAFAGEGGYLTADPNTVEVTTNAAEEGATFTEASFQMPAFDATADYELVRDMSYKVAFSGVPTRARLAKDGNGKFHFADGLTFQLLDNIDAANPKDITSAAGITFMVGEVEAVDFEGNTFYQLNKATLVPLADFLADAHLGTYAICAVASTGEYDGSFTSGRIELFQGYEVEVAAKEFITYYKDEPLYVEDEAAELYTIESVNGDQATLSAAIETAPSLTPLLIFNNSDQAKTFLLIPANEEPSPISYYGGFIGTTDAATILASTEGTTNYALNGKAFVFVKNAIEVGPNKAWLSVNTGVPSARITLVFSDDETTGLSEKGIVNSEKFATATWYDLNGRKIAAPSKKGIYIMNGKKVVVK